MILRGQIVTYEEGSAALLLCVFQIPRRIITMQTKLIVIVSYTLTEDTSCSHCGIAEPSVPVGCTPW